MVAKNGVEWPTEAPVLLAWEAPALLAWEAPVLLAWEAPALLAWEAPALVQEVDWVRRVDVSNHKLGG